MGVFFIFLTALALSLDAFAVSISCGMKLGSRGFPKFFKVSLAFGLFQALMPAIGWYFGNSIKGAVDSYAKYMAFGIFFVLAIRTFYDGVKLREVSSGACCNCSSLRCLFSLALATSIDALVIGMVLSFLETPLVLTFSMIGIVTFLNTLLGCFLGSRTQKALGNKAHLASGLILLGLSLKALFS